MDDRTHQLAQIFRAMANLLASQRANPYRVRAYRKAADSILTVTGDLADLAARHQLQEIPGIGRDLAVKIEEFLATGTIRAYEELKTPLPGGSGRLGFVAGPLRGPGELLIFPAEHPHIGRPGKPGCVPSLTNTTRFFRVGRHTARRHPRTDRNRADYAAGRSSLKIFQVFSSSTAF